MKLVKIEFENFRGYYGKVSVDISNDESKNLTLIVGGNETGKTNILNSVMKCFHNESSPNFKDKENIINLLAKKEGASTAKVSVTFEHEKDTYIATRTWKDGSNKNDFGKEFKINRVVNGSLDPYPRPSQLINMIMPLSMASYFIFDGESAVKMADDSNAKVLSKSTNDILGTHLIENALNDLKAIERKVQKDVDANDNSEKLKKIKNQMEHKQNELDTLTKEAIKFNEIYGTNSLQLEDINKALEGYDKSKPLMEKSSNLHSELERAKVDLLEHRKEKITWLRNNAQAILSSKLISSTDEILTTAMKKGEIPSTYSRPFIDKLLEDKKCICGEKFELSDERATKIKTYLDGAGTIKSSMSISKAQGRLNELQRQSDSSNNSFILLNKKEKKFNQKIYSIETQLNELKSELVNVTPIDNGDNKAAMKMQLESSLEEIKEKRAINNFKTEEVEKDLAALKNEFTNLIGNSTKDQLIKKKLLLIEKIIIEINSTLSIEREEARLTIEKKMNTLLKLSIKNEVCKIDESFNLVVYNKIDNSVEPKSAGKTNLLSLMYVASLLEFCKERRGAEKEFLINGTNAPLILDAPFSNLGKEYIKMCASFIPKMTEQVILLTKEDTFDEIKDWVKDKIGSLYYITYMSDDIDKENISHDIYGQECILTQYNEDIRRSEINKVKI